MSAFRTDRPMTFIEMAKSHVPVHVYNFTGIDLVTGKRIHYGILSSPSRSGSQLIASRESALA